MEKRALEKEDKKFLLRISVETRTIFWMKNCQK